MVGAVDIDRQKVGKDLSEVLGLSEKLGIIVSSRAENVLQETHPDILLHSTSSHLETVYPQILQGVDVKADVISTAEELAYPFEKHPDIARDIDERARLHGVTVLGTGVNPGFAMDTLAIVLTGVCQRVDAIRVERTVDVARRRFQLQRKVGAGLTVKEFERRVNEGSIRHVGLPESVSLIASAMQLKLEEIQEKTTPVIADTPVESEFVKVESGMVAGVRQVAKGILAGQDVIVLDLKMYMGAKDPHDSILIEGVPPIDMTIRGGIHGDLATAAIVVNAIPIVVDAQPGLRVMSELPPIHNIAGLIEEPRGSTVLRRL